MFKDTPQVIGRARTKVVGSSLPANMLFPVQLPQLTTFRVLLNPNFSELKVIGGTECFLSLAPIAWQVEKLSSLARVCNSILTSSLQASSFATSWRRAILGQVPSHPTPCPQYLPMSRGVEGTGWRARLSAFEPLKPRWFLRNHHFHSVLKAQLNVTPVFSLNVSSVFLRQAGRVSSQVERSQVNTV